MISSWHVITSLAVYDQQLFNEIRRLEGTNKGRPYLDTTGNPSAGIGFNLRGNRTVRDDVFLKMQIDPNFTGLSPAQQAAERGYIAQLNSAVAASYASTAVLQQALDRIMGSRARDPLFAGISRITNLTTFTMTDPQMQAVFPTAAQDAESKVNAWLAGIPQSNERIALVSLAYNNLIGIDSSGQFKSPALRQAIINNDRAEAWYQIRYESNGGQSRIASGPGIATRRYVESDHFGLYNGAGQPQTEGEAINILRVLRTHQGAIDKYEAQFSVADAGSQYFRLQLQPTYGYLISRFNLGGSPEQVLVSLNLLGGDAIQGTDANELLLGDISHDILIGGGGNDLLVGGQGKDVYVYNSGDGEDTILDTDGQGLVVFDHHLLQGGLKKQSESVYKSLDGQITYQRSGSDLVVNGTLTIKDWQEGQFGIRLKELPDDPEEPEENAVGCEYKRIDHYVHVGVDAEGHPIMAPVFVDFFDEGPNNSSDSTLVPPIGDENNSINAFGENDRLEKARDEAELVECGGRWI